MELFCCKHNLRWTNETGGVSPGRKRKLKSNTIIVRLELRAEILTTSSSVKVIFRAVWVTARRTRRKTLAESKAPPSWGLKLAVLTTTYYNFQSSFSNVGIVDFQPQLTLFQNPAIEFNFLQREHCASVLSWYGRPCGSTEKLGCAWVKAQSKSFVTSLSKAERLMAEHRWKLQNSLWITSCRPSAHPANDLPDAASLYRSNCAESLSPY